MIGEEKSTSSSDLVESEAATLCLFYDIYVLTGALIRKRARKDGIGGAWRFVAFGD